MTDVKFHGRAPDAGRRFAMMLPSQWTSSHVDRHLLFVGGAWERGYTNRGLLSINASVQHKGGMEMLVLFSRILSASYDVCHLEA